MANNGFEAGSVYYVVELETGNLVRQSREVNQAVGSIERSFTAVAAAVGSLIAALSIERVVRESINAARAFEKTLADLSAITGATGADLARLKEEAKLLGATTTASAGQVVEAMKLIASAKPELLETSGALAAVTKEAIALADASGLALPIAAEALTLALNQFGEGADQASRFVNVLAAGAKFGASEIADTALALKNSAVSAAAAGVSFEETNAALQGLAAAGIKGGEAGTALRNVILKLENSTDTKLKPSVNGLAGALDNLNAKNLSSTALTKLFGLENVNAAQALVGSAEAVRNLTGQLTGTQTAYEQASINTATFDAAVKRMTNALDLALIKLGDELLPIAGAAASAITALAQAFVDGAPAIQAAGSALEVVMIMIAAVITGKVVGALTLFSLLLYRAIPVIGAATIATRGFAAALSFLGGPIGVAAGALALLALNWDTLAGSARSAAEITEDSADRIQAALAKGGLAAQRSLGSVLADYERQLAVAQADLAALTAGTPASPEDQGSTGSSGDIDAALGRVQALERAAARARKELAALGTQGGRGDEINPPLVRGEPDAPPGAPGDPNAARRAADERLKGYLAEVEGERRFNDEINELITKQAQREQEQRDAALEAERQFAQDRNQARAFAEDISAEADPAEQVRLYYSRRQEALNEMWAMELLGEQEHARALVANEQQKLAALEELRKRDNDMQAQAQLQSLQLLGQFTGDIFSLLQQAGKERTGLAKALFLAERAIAVATIIMNTEVAAAKAGAQLGIFGLPLAATIRATGYASAGLVAGQALATTFGGGRQYGGYTTPGVMNRVNENGKPEMFVGSAGQQYLLPNSRGEVIPAGGASGGWTIIVEKLPANLDVRPAGVDSERRIVRLAVSEVARQVRDNDGEVWNGLTASSNVRGRF